MNRNPKTIILITIGLLLCVLAGAIIGCTSPTSCPTPAPGVYDAEPSGITTFNNLSTRNLTALGTVTLPTGAVANAALAAPKAYYVLPLHIDDIAASVAITTAYAGFQMPFAATLTEVSFWARTVTGTVTCDAYETGTTVLSSAATITSGTPAVATVSDATIADNAEIAIGCATGAGESVTDLTVLLTFKASHTN